MRRLLVLTLLSAILLVLKIALPSSAFAQTAPRLSVLVKNTEDRWITFADGVKLRMGFEVSPTLIEELMKSDRYLVFFDRGSAIHNFSTRSLTENSRQTLDELKSRMPGYDFSNFEKLWQKSFNGPGRETGHETPRTLSNSSETRRDPPETMHLIIRPRVETLLYASGLKSNRIVYGFSPDRLNPFNQGREGALDNEFIQTAEQKEARCHYLDFFNGQLNVTGFGPGRSNFGADSDEGISFSIFGYGIEFRRKEFQVKTEIVFEVESPHSGFKKTYRHELKGFGKDLFVGGQYKGITVGVEIQRRKTLRQALTQMIPQIAQDMMSRMPAVPWETEIIAQHQEKWMIRGGENESLRTGTELISNYGSIYKIVEVSTSASLVVADSQNSYAPFIGEVLRIKTQDGGEWNFGRSFTIQNSEASSEGSVQIQTQSSPDDVQESNPCFKAPVSGWEKFLMGVSWLYGFYRYQNVYDQPFDAASTVGVSSSSGALLTNTRTKQTKIAILGSGVYPKENQLQGHLDSTGFDFLSWDSRPADDLGMGTAAALLLKSKLQTPFQIVPFKVLGPHGETHSSALYQAFEHISQRPDITHVAVPFKPVVPSEAYRRGVELLVQTGKVVVIPQGVQVTGAITAPAYEKDFVTKGFESVQVRLSGIGVGVIEAAAQLIKEGQ